MKKLIIGCVVFICSLSAHATDPQQKFSPEKYQADLEQFITNEASLTPQEAAKFFPLFREMQKKQRSIYAKMKAEEKIKPVDEENCKKFIQMRDQVELELKSIQQTYHNRFFNVLPASKVFDVIKAEDRFHRRMFRNWGQGPRGNGQPQNHKKHQK